MSGGSAPRGPSFGYDQADLARLCASRTVYATELHNTNEAYGFDRILKAYAGLPEDEPLPWAMEHSISFENPEPFEADVETSLPFVLAVTEEQARILRARTAAEVLPIGSAFFYLQALLGGAERPPSERRGTLVFPHKSPSSHGQAFDAERWAEELAALPAEYQPVAVSVFWLDYLRGAHLPFEKAGLMLVTSGHNFDPLFLHRQDELCRRFEYACANDISASFCFAVLSGCRFFFQQNRGEPNLPTKRLCAGASPFPPRDLAEQRRLAERFAGRESVRAPEFFRELFHEGWRRIHASAPRSVDFGVGTHLGRAAGWRPRGIDADGWARRECSIVIPAGSGHVGVALTIDVPAVPQDPPLWFVHLDERTLALRPAPGRHRLEIPCARSAPTRVAVRAGSEIALEEGQRRRALRLVAIDWCAEPSLAWALERDGDLWTPCVPPPALDFDAGPSAADLSAWQLEGIDAHGWAGRRAALVVPRNAAVRGVRLDLDVPTRAALTLEVAGRATRVRARSGRCSVDVPLEEPRARSIKLRSDDDDLVDQHRRAFRIRRIAWL